MKTKFPDPVKHCILYKKLGCSHVDGMLCNFDTCKERLYTEIWELEEQLNIPLKDRCYYNKNKDE
jgi:hypothetical protein